MISDFDLYLACEGTHRNLADILGARPVVNSTGLVDGYYFSVWAPNAKRISVVGDFNDWNIDASLMTRIPETDFWEIYIEGVGTGELYKYCILTADDKMVYKADPMAKYAERRPKTASKTYFDSYHWHDLSWCIKHSTPQDKNAPMAIYEMHMGSWMRGQDNKMLSYSAVADALVKFLKENRYTHVEIMPLAEHPYDGSWGYQATGYFAPTSRYGTPEEFKYFVDVMHQNSIGVILDWVPGHFPKDAHGLVSFDGTNLYEKNQDTSEWGTLKFNFGSKMVRQFLISNALYWLKDFHVDGLRVDAVSHMLNLDFTSGDSQNVCEDKDAVEFLKQLNTVIKEERPGAIMIAEESQNYPKVTHPVSEGGLGFDYKWNMGWMNDTLKYMEADPLFRGGIHNKLTFSMMYAFNEQYILPVSHDECVHGKKSLLDKMNGDYYQKFASVKAYLGYMFAHPGKKLLFMGSEIGQFMEWRYYEQIEWKLLQYETHRGLYGFTKKLLALYNDEPAFWQKDDSWDGFSWLNPDDAQSSVYSFMRKSDEDTIAVFVNMTPVERFDYWVKGADEGTYSLLLNSDEKAYGGEGTLVAEEISTDCDSAEFPNRLRVNLPPMSIVMYKKNK
ncbi:MAG: 1,4-alpha-glucan branching protein GlgB [Clostridia bacterium]|nr:1,4-alpha-glucan branching protein GlgB [Clostridia bacterium]